MSILQDRPRAGALRAAADRQAAIEDVIARLDAIDVSDPERAHGEVDDILLSLAPVEVREAVERVRGRAPWWAGA